MTSIWHNKAENDITDNEAFPFETLHRDATKFEGQICNQNYTDSDEEIDVVTVDDKNDFSKEMYILKCINDEENITTAKEEYQQSQKQTTTLNVSNTNKIQDTSEATPKTFVVKGDEIQTKQHSVIYECPKCGKKTNRKNNMVRHTETCGINLRHLRCKFCPYDTKYKYEIARHMENIHKLQPEQYVNIVNKIIEEGEKMKANGHLVSTNGAEVNTTSRAIDYRDFVQLYCSKCNESYRYANLKKERNCRICKTVMLLQCIKCAKSYPKMATMYSHLRYKCAPRNCFKCSDCDFASFNKQSLIVHVSRKHTIVDPENYEKCTKCPKQYKYRSDRIRHEKNCGKKPWFQCSLCPYQSKSMEYFNSHMYDHRMHLFMLSQLKPRFLYF